MLQQSQQVPVRARRAMTGHGCEILNRQLVPMFCPSSSQEISLDQKEVTHNLLDSTSSTGTLYLAAHYQCNSDDFQLMSSSD